MFQYMGAWKPPTDRKSAGQGKSADLGGGRSMTTTATEDAALDNLDVSIHGGVEAPN